MWKQHPNNPAAWHKENYPKDKIKEFGAAFAMTHEHTPYDICSCTEDKKAKQKKLPHIVTSVAYARG